MRKKRIGEERRKALMWRVPLSTALIIALFWGIWYLIVGSVPTVTSVQWGKWTIQLPFAISRWTDVLFAPIFAFFPVAYFTSMRIATRKESKKSSSLFLRRMVVASAFVLAFGLVVVGLTFGLSFGLVAGLFLGGLAAGLLIGGLDVDIGLADGLIGGLRLGLSVVGLIFAWGFGLIFGWGIGLVVGFVVGLIFGLGFGLGVVMGVVIPILPRFLSSLCRKAFRKGWYWFIAADKQ